MNVLSIDFDYFQNVSEKVLQNYPDGIDSSTIESEYIWADCYNKPHNDISKVRIIDKEFETIKRILTTIEPSSPIMIANSHKHIYNFIVERAKADSPLSVVNVDMHHDFINDNPKLDCGNWISHLEERQEDGKFRLRWVANPISVSMYGLFDNISGSELLALKKMIPTSLSDIEDERFDAVFMCRSDTWTPPHLDKYFTELCKVAKSHFGEVIMENGIDTPRTFYLDYVKILTEYLDSAKAEIKAKNDFELEH